MFSADELSIILGCCISTTYLRLRNNNIKPLERFGGKWYNLDNLRMLLEVKEEVIKYYPLKTTVVYEVYQSKLNTM